MSKRRPLRTTLNANSNMNFRPGGPDVTRTDAKGTRPTAPPTSIREILVMTIMHVCKKSIFFDTNLKVALYLGSLFLISLIGDFIPFPKTYLARSDNLFNLYFVKIGWGWTLMLTIPFTSMTSYTLCCGDVNKLCRYHVPRIVIATFFWFSCTKLFNVIENSYGRCTIRGYLTKSGCLKAGYLWHGFDISGHVFILIYASLILIEEARPIIKWESIQEHLRNELHDRSISETCSTNPLRNLNDEQIRCLTISYERFTPIIRTLFIGMTALQLLWDIMLVGTMLYYHRMIEKFIGGVIAILIWYFTYRFWYCSRLLPELPGCGTFIYQRLNKDSSGNKRYQNNINTNIPSNSGARPTNVANTNNTPSSPFPTFMGMPLYNVTPTKNGSNSASTIQISKAFNNDINT